MFSDWNHIRKVLQYLGRVWMTVRNVTASTCSSRAFTQYSINLMRKWYVIISVCNVSFKNELIVWILQEKLPDFWQFQFSYFYRFFKTNLKFFTSFSLNIWSNWCCFCVFGENIVCNSIIVNFSYVKIDHILRNCQFLAVTTRSATFLDLIS